MTNLRGIQGFSLLELAIVLGVAGAMAMAAFGFFGRRTVQGSGADAAASAFQRQVVGAVVRFAQRNHRLPCADTDGDGLEGTGVAGCAASGDAVGAVPFSTLGITVPVELGGDFARRLIYGVYRSPSAAAADDADLARLVERNGHVPGEIGFNGRDDLVRALASAQRNGQRSALLRVAAPGDGSGTDCAAPAANVAFVLVGAGARDADRRAGGNPFDGPNSALQWPGGGATCAANPDTERSEHYDDEVVAVGFTELIGRLGR